MLKRYWLAAGFPHPYIGNELTSDNLKLKINIAGSILEKGNGV